MLWIFIGVFFAGAGTWIYFGILKPPVTARKILKNGIETTANIIDVGSNVRINKFESRGVEERYYHLKLSFLNQAGKTVAYKSNSIYPHSFIAQMDLAEYNDVSKKYDIATKEPIQVMSLGNKAVVKDFVPDNKSSWWLWILAVVFSALGFGIIISLAAGAINVAVESIIKQHGTPGTGVYSSHTYDTVPTPAKLYTIYFTFENAKEKTIVNKKVISNSDIEAEILIKMGSFPIKYMGNKAVIMLNKNEILQYYEQLMLEKK